MRRWGLTLAILVLGGVVAFGQQLPAEPEVETEQTEVLVQTIENDPIPLRDWEVPSLPDLTAGHHRLRAGTEALPSDPSPMIAMIPCRIVDTRWAAGAWGGPYLHAGVARLFDLNSAPHCPGIPSNVSAYSVNVTVTNPAAAGWITIWPGGAAEVTISTLNYLAGQTVANAAITPAGTGGSITVKSVADTHLIIDINGYFRDGTVLSSGSAWVTSGPIVVGGANYIYPATSPTITLPTGGVCQVTAMVQINTAGPRSLRGPFMRIAVKRGGVDSNDNVFGFYFPEVESSGYTPALTRTLKLDIASAQGTRFGCYLNGAPTEWLGDAVDCIVSWSCF